MTAKLAEYANNQTPQDVHVPNSWPGLMVWAIGKFGIGVVFAAMLIYVYLDLRKVSDALVEVVRANAVAIQTLAEKVEQTNIKVDRIEREQRDSHRNNNKPYQSE